MVVCADRQKPAPAAARGGPCQTRGMPTFEELEAGWLADPGTRGARGRVRVIVVRLGDGAHALPPSCQVEVAGGIVGDRWSRAEAPHPEAQVTLMSARVCELLGGGTHRLDRAGDNFVLDGLDLSEAALPAGTRLRVGGAVLEVTAKSHLGCAKFSERFGQDALRWVNWKDHRERRLRGVNCKIIEAGTVALGDEIYTL